jgi:hypothetical protein
VVTIQENVLTFASPGAVTPAGAKTVMDLATMKGKFQAGEGSRLPRPRHKNVGHTPPLEYQSARDAIRTRPR